jgi:RNA-directed DNA polymerase
VILYTERWLKAPLQLPDGSLVERTKGTPQGSVGGPILSNLFLHYVFDTWMTKHYPRAPWCRYADDGLVHCRTEQEALQILAALKERFEVCKIELHPTKTKIVYCKDGSRKGQYSQTQFDFLGYTFRRRLVKNSKRNSMFVSFTPAVSKTAQKSMRAETRRWGLRNRTDLGLNDIANMYNPILRGWIGYYGRYCPSALYPVLRHFNKTLIAWAMRKYKKLKGHKTRPVAFLEKILERQPELFVHWRKGMVGAFT